MCTDMMNQNRKNIGFAITGSFCMFSSILPVMESLVQESYDVTPILSYSSQEFDTRFTDAKTFRQKVEYITQKDCICSIVDAEPIGPKALFDLLILAPCTGNTLAKLASGITDSPVLMAAKAHLRNQRPLLIFLSSNDALGMNLKNIGLLLNTKYIYFVPFHQDDWKKKPNSLVSIPSLVLPAMEHALRNEQIQPLLTNC